MTATAPIAMGPSEVWRASRTAGLYVGTFSTFSTKAKTSSTGRLMTLTMSNSFMATPVLTRDKVWLRPQREGSHPHEGANRPLRRVVRTGHGANGRPVVARAYA